MGIKIIKWPSLPYCTMSAFGGDALQRNAMLHKSSFIIIDSVLSSFRFHQIDKVLHGKPEIDVSSQFN